MSRALRMRPLRAAALLTGIMLVAGCSVNPANSPPAPITSSQPLGVSEAPAVAVPSNKRTAARSALHHPRVATLKSKRHFATGKKHRAHIRTAKATVLRVHHKASEPETAADAGVVHHIGPKIIPLD
jgi:PBP1b-binding outer membrane lipoprotein LpoB